MVMMMFRKQEKEKFKIFEIPYFPSVFRIQENIGLLKPKILKNISLLRRDASEGTKKNQIWKCVYVYVR